MTTITDLRELPNIYLRFYRVGSIEEAEKTARENQSYYYETPTLKHKYVYIVHLGDMP